MYQKTITYTDFDGNEQKEDFWFHLTKAEITEMEYSKRGGLTQMIEKLRTLQDTGKIIALIKDLVLRSYGEKVMDRNGKERFIKTESLREAFAATEAYSEMFMGFLHNPDAFNEFIIGIMPVDMQADAKRELDKLKMNGGKPDALPAAQGSVAPPKAIR